MMRIITLQQIGIKILLNLMKIMQTEFKTKKTTLIFLTRIKSLEIL